VPDSALGVSVRRSAGYRRLRRLCEEYRAGFPEVFTTPISVLPWARVAGDRIASLVVIGEDVP
jgi:hypothetical protein